MENQWLAWAKRLQAIASSGAFFGESEFDRERYDEIADISHRMLASLGDVPIKRIVDLVPDFAKGYATPKVDVRGAVIRGEEILLVREKLDGLWTLPGGFADVGISPAGNVEKEILEEACIPVKARRLYGVFHKAMHEYAQDTRDFYKLFFLCDPLDEATPVAGPEALDARYFHINALPPLSTGRVIEKHIALAFEYTEDADKHTTFD